MDLSSIPHVDAVLRSDEGRRLLERYPRPVVVDRIREVADSLRNEGAEGGAEGLAPGEFVSLVERALARWANSGTRRVVNATGVILHTGLGRAVLPKKALDALAEHASGYSRLEIELDTGKRGRRGGHAEELLCRLSGAEAAAVVNNNAAATVLVLSGVAAGREVIVSRGQLIEIGGAFRLPEIMAASGAELVEVGTTNRTYLRDYESAITDRTALLLHVHTSNYAITGFSAEVPVCELVKLGGQRGLPVVDDLGSGALVDTAKLGLAKEPLVKDSVAAGASLVTFSTDKLIGGPQGGAIVGRRELVEPLSKHPLARAFRVGKLTLIALEAALALYLDEESALEAVPALGMLRASPVQLKERALGLAGMIGKLQGAAVTVEEGYSELGGGALATERIPTWAVAISPEAPNSPDEASWFSGLKTAQRTASPHSARLGSTTSSGRRGSSADELAARLRSNVPPIFARINSGRVLLDVRTMLTGEDEIVAAAVRRAFQV